MAVYIDREALLQYIKKSNPYMYHQLAIITNIMPPADVVPVVRCVDCKYRCTIVCPMFHTEYSWDTDDGCDCYDVDCTDDDGFCHLGERRDGDPDG